MQFPVSLEILALFCVTELAFSASPGPAFFLVVSRALRGGMFSAAASAAGVLVGNLFYFAVSATAVGVILFSLREWFFVAQWFGAAYLLWLAARIFRSPESAGGVGAERSRVAMRAAFRESFVMQLANPKTIVFFIAFLPLFLDPAKSAAAQIAVLACASFLVEAAVLFAYSLAARRSALILGAKFERTLSRASALLLCAAALSLLFIAP